MMEVYDLRGWVHRDTEVDPPLLIGTRIPEVVGELLDRKEVAEKICDDAIAVSYTNEEKFVTESVKEIRNLIEDWRTRVTKVLMDLPVELPDFEKLETVFEILYRDWSELRLDLAEFIALNDFVEIKAEFNVPADSKLRINPANLVLDEAIAYELPGMLILLRQFDVSGTEREIVNENRPLVASLFESLTSLYTLMRPAIPVSHPERYFTAHLPQIASLMTSVKVGLVAVVRVFPDSRTDPRTRTLYAIRRILHVEALGIGLYLERALKQIAEA